MGLIKSIVNRISRSDAEKTSYWIVARCNRCGETVRARVNLYNDLSINYGEGGEATTYFCRKLLTGEGRCFERIEVALTFDEKRQLIDRNIRGGTFVDESGSGKA
jgi:hypothetical protein